MGKYTASEIHFKCYRRAKKVHDRLERGESAVQIAQDMGFTESHINAINHHWTDAVERNWNQDWGPSCYMQQIYRQLRREGLIVETTGEYGYA